MPSKKPSLKEINFHIKDERKAVVDYKEDHLPKFAREEAGHLKYWQAEKAKLLKKK